VAEVRFEREERRSPLPGQPPASGSQLPPRHAQRPESHALSGGEAGATPEEVGGLGGREELVNARFDSIHAAIDQAPREQRFSARELSRGVALPRAGEGKGGGGGRSARPRPGPGGRPGGAPGGGER